MIVKSVPLNLPDGFALVDLLPDADIVGWLHGTDGLVGWGQAFQLEVAAAHQFPAAIHAWQQLVAAASVADDVQVFGSGLVAFGSFSFDPQSEAGGVLVVPRVLIGRRDGVSWLTTVDSDVTPSVILAEIAEVATHPEPVRTPTAVTEYRASLAGTEWQLEAAAWQAAVTEALERIAAGACEKVVLARQVTLAAPAPFSPTWVLARLAHRFTDTWNFAVDSLVGATPELLVSVRDGQVRSRVLAGTAPIPPDSNEASTWKLGAALLDSVKDRAEHAHAVTSVANALAPFCGDLIADGPKVLELPNVLHLATDILSKYADPQNAITSLYLASALHPSAAVCGTPTDSALTVIRDLEDFDRGRYAGPVGWISANGDGEWGIALRCAQLAGPQAKLLAGCGIVAGSQPAAELLESEAKLAPMRWALGELRDQHPMAQAWAATGATRPADGAGSDAPSVAAKASTRPKLHLVP